MLVERSVLLFLATYVERYSPEASHPSESDIFQTGCAQVSIEKLCFSSSLHASCFHFTLAFSF